MMKNIMILILLSWVSFTHAKTEVAPESMADSESYKLDKPVREQEVQRGVAGGKMKKRQVPEKMEEPKEDSDSEVRYWQFQE